MERVAGSKAVCPATSTPGAALSRGSPPGPSVRPASGSHEAGRLAARASSARASCVPGLQKRERPAGCATRGPSAARKSSAWPRPWDVSAERGAGEKGHWGSHDVWVAQAEQGAGRGQQEAEGEQDVGEAAPEMDVRRRLALLELYTSGSDDEGPATPYTYPRPPARSPSVAGANAGDRPALTVADKLQQQLKVVVEEEVVIPIGVRKKLVRKNVKPVTEAQRRNLRRAEYLDEVSQRNDSTFFFVVLSSVFVPPVVILAVAYASGYLEFLN